VYTETTTPSNCTGCWSAESPGTSFDSLLAFRQDVLNREAAILQAAASGCTLNIPAFQGGGTWGYSYVNITNPTSGTLFGQCYAALENILGESMEMFAFASETNNTCQPGFSYITSQGNCELTNPSAGDSSLFLCGQSHHPGAEATTLPIGAKNAGANSCCAADPITISTGNVYEEENDYVASTVGALKYVRYYNSDPTVHTGRLGLGWRDTYDRSIVVSTDLNASANYHGTTIALAYRPDGKVIVFNISNTGVITAADTDVVERLSSVTMPDGTTGWELIDAADTAEYYEVVPGQITSGPAHYGELSYFVTRGGMQTTLSYAAAGAGLNPFLTGVSDPFGHTLTFTADSTGARVATMTDTAGNSYSYDYNAGGNLSDLYYPGSPTAHRQYQYTTTSNTSTTLAAPMISAILDESGNTLSTWSYDYLGRAVSNSMGGTSLNAAPYAFSYVTQAANGSVPAITKGTGTTVTYGAAGQSTYTFSTVNGVPQATKVVSLTGTGGSITTSAVVDANDRTTSETNGNGITTTHTYSTDGRGLETQRTEASGASLARTIATQWSTAFRVPTQISVYNGGSATGTAVSTTAFTYDSLGNWLTKTVTDPASGASRTWTRTFDSYGRPLTQKSPRTDVSSVITYTYSTCTTGGLCGQLTSITDELGRQTIFNTYNADGYPLSITDPNGVITALSYDPRNRLTSRTTGGETTTLSYLPTGLLQSVTLADSTVLTYTYDAAHRLTQVADSLGNKIAYTLDSMGNVTAESNFDPTSVLDKTITRTFDALSRLATTIGSANTSAVTTTFSYDNNSNVSGIAAPLSRTTSNTYDALNRIAKIVNATSGVTQYQYSAIDNLTQVTDPRGLVTTYQYNGLSDRVSLTSPDTGTTTFTYDSGGNLATATDARSSVASFAYDIANRPTSAAYTGPSGSDPTITFSYDAGANGLGRLTGAADNNHSLTWGYDGLGRVTSKTQVVGSVSATVGYQYTNGDLTQMTTPSGQVITYTYTDHNITGISINGTSVITNVSYESFGPASGWTWANGTSEVRLYNADGNPSQMGGPELLNFGYDNAFRITGLTDTSNAALSWTDGYDALDRLTSAAETGSAFGWTYDADGNRLSQTGTGASTFLPSTTSNRLASVSGTLSRTYSYDPAGNTLAYASTTFGYNNRGRMVASSTSTSSTSYIYNAIGERIQKSGVPTGTINFVYDEVGHLLGEYNPSGGLIEETVWMGDLPVAVLQPNGAGGMSTFYIHADQLNAPRIITQPSSNTIVWRWDADPFGTAAANSNPSGLGTFTYNQRYAGQYADVETGLNYNYFRDYDTNTGKYLESDPIGLKGGVNTFAYAISSPLRNADRTGLDVWIAGPAGNSMPLHQNFNVGNPNGTYVTYSTALDVQRMFDAIVYKDPNSGGNILAYKTTTPAVDAQLIHDLALSTGANGTYGPNNNCRSWSQNQFNNTPGTVTKPYVSFAQSLINALSAAAQHFNEIGFYAR
jgi:RHS repeat-associated protein